MVRDREILATRLVKGSQLQNQGVNKILFSLKIAKILGHQSIIHGQTWAKKIHFILILHSETKSQ